jgi:hypothetical protein
MRENRQASEHPRTATWVSVAAARRISRPGPPPPRSIIWSMADGSAAIFGCHHGSVTSDRFADRLTDHVESSKRGITATMVPGLILAVLPSLRGDWAEIEDENADPEGVGGRLGYLDAGWVVRHLADRFAAGDTSEFGAAFALIEHLISNGDAYVSELGVIGYLEGLQMAAVTSRGIDPETFRPWFGPLSQRYWNALNEFWEKGIPIPRIEPAEDDPDTRLRRGESVSVNRLTLVSRIGWLDLEVPIFLQSGERYRVDWEARIVIVEGRDGTLRSYPANPQGPESMR